MFTTKAGQKFGSAFVGRKKDAMHAEDGKQESAKHESAETPEFEAGEKEGMGENATPAGKVVAEHGKATAVHIKHDHVAHKHHVTSMHEDGHVHESDHATPEEAHQAAATLGGEGAANNAENESGMGAEASPMGDKMAGIFGGGQ